MSQGKAPAQQKGNPHAGTVAPSESLDEKRKLWLQRRAARDQSPAGDLADPLPDDPQETGMHCYRAVGGDVISVEPSWTTSSCCSLCLRRRLPLTTASEARL